VDAHPGRTFHARIAQVRFGSKTVSGVVTYEPSLSLDNADLSSCGRGMTATAVVTVQKVENCVVVPNAALRFVPGNGGSADVNRPRRVAAEDPSGPATHPTQGARRDERRRETVAGVDNARWASSSRCPSRWAQTDGIRTEIKKAARSTRHGAGRPTRSAETNDTIPFERPNGPLIELKNVSKVYGGGSAATHALRGIDLAIGRGDSYRDGAERLRQVPPA